jgi:hypothetical protein
MIRDRINKIIFFAAFPMLLLSCAKKDQVFESSCNDNIIFKKVELTELIRHLKAYDKQYVEVTGKYIEGSQQSALFNDSLFADHSLKKALWVNFNQECPLFLKGSHVGLFEYNNGTFTKINKRRVTIKGKIDMHNTGYLNRYQGSMDRVSYIKL